MIYTITLIEDDAYFAALVKKLIDQNKQLGCTAVYAGIESATLEFPQAPSDIILMDIQLPDGSGVELTAKFKQLFPEVQIIMCSSFDDDEKVFNSLKSGASGYLVKTDSPEQIVESILEVTQGGAPMSMGIARKVIQYFRHLELEKHVLDVLTTKENELLALLAKGLFYKEIAAKLNIELDTVKKHCGNIYRKLHVSNRTEATNVFNKRKLS